MSKPNAIKVLNYAALNKDFRDSFCTSPMMAMANHETELDLNQDGLNPEEVDDLISLNNEYQTFESIVHDSDYKPSPNDRTSQLIGFL